MYRWWLRWVDWGVVVKVEYVVDGDGISWLYLFDVGVFSKDNQEGTLSCSLVLLPNLVPKSSSKLTSPTVFRKPWQLAHTNRPKMMIGISTGARRSLSMTLSIKSGYIQTKESITSGTSIKFVVKIFSLKTSNATKKLSNVKAKLKKLQAMITCLSHITFLANILSSLKSSKKIKTKSVYG